MSWRKMKETAPGVWLVWDEPLPMGKSPVCGAVVMRWPSGIWSCDDHGTVGGFPPAGSTEPHCDHINFTKKHVNGNKEKEIEMKAYDRAVEKMEIAAAGVALLDEITQLGKDLTANGNISVVSLSYGLSKIRDRLMTEQEYYSEKASRK